MSNKDELRFSQTEDQPSKPDSLDKRSVDAVQEDVRNVYCADERPWVLGYSGGKDSTATLQLLWYALAKLPRERLRKTIHVIASDTLVEAPAIVDRISATLDQIRRAAEDAGLPFSTEKVRPQLEDTFWVNMLGRGYPAPYRRFRWCTDRLKIQPANRFIEDCVQRHGEVILILGSRRAESATRAQVMSLHRKPGELLSRHTVLKSAWVYTPIEHFSTQDVWTYLLSVSPPWGGSNRDLVTLYRNANAGECPLVVDTTTPSCGNSRFGCWTCTVVERDKSMEAMIDAGEDWMEPLLELRDFLATTQEPARKKEFREVRRRNGRVQIWGEHGNKIIWGPYKFGLRKEILRKLLIAQKYVQTKGPDPTMKLISDAELHEIRRLWRTEEGDWEDSLPKIYREVLGEELDWVEEDSTASTSLERDVLERVAARHQLPPEILRELIDLERQVQGLAKRGGIYDKIDRILAKDWRTAEEVLTEIAWQPEDEAEPPQEAVGRDEDTDAS